jgi:Domain of unknown function (DUF4398)
MHPDSLPHLFMRTCQLTCLFGAVLLAACASAPVQEMSDARQAIRAAQEAGAARTAAQPLSDAQVALNRAEAQLKKRFFGAARRNAEEAHQKAALALQQARDAKEEKK